MSLWPEAGSIGSVVGPCRSISDIEKEFSEVFFGKQVVLFSSGRYALFGILSSMNLTRNDLVFTLPYSSHCVLNVISYLATPSVLGNVPTRAQVLYHQWGYETLCPKKGTQVIEDSVDSLITSEEALFRNKGEFELFSLPKLVGTWFGGFVLCRNEQAADRLRESRDKMQRNSLLQTSLRLLNSRFERAVHYWGNSEPLNGEVGSYMRRNIWIGLQELKRTASVRLEILEKLRELSPNHLAITPGRIPTALIYKSEIDIAGKHRDKMVVRNRVYFEESELRIEPVYLVPCHLASIQL